MKIAKVNLNEKFGRFDEYWAPRIVGELNHQLVKIAKFKGEFVMHHHEHEDELFYVVEGTLNIELDEEVIEIQQGEFVIIPKGTSHKPFAKEEVKVLLFEPASTRNTGEDVNERTVDNLEWI